MCAVSCAYRMLVGREAGCRSGWLASSSRAVQGDQEVVARMVYHNAEKEIPMILDILLSVELVIQGLVV